MSQFRHRNRAVDVLAERGDLAADDVPQGAVAPLVLVLQNLALLPDGGGAQLPERCRVEHLPSDQRTQPRALIVDDAFDEAGQRPAPKPPALLVLPEQLRIVFGLRKKGLQRELVVPLDAGVLHAVCSQRSSALPRWTAGFGRPPGTFPARPEPRPSSSG